MLLAFRGCCCCSACAAAAVVADVLHVGYVFRHSIGRRNNDATSNTLRESAHPRMTHNSRNASRAEAFFPPASDKLKYDRRRTLDVVSVCLDRTGRNTNIGSLYPVFA